MTHVTFRFPIHEWSLIILEKLSKTLYKMLCLIESVESMLPQTNRRVDKFWEGIVISLEGFSMIQNTLQHLR